MDYETYLILLPEAAKAVRFGELNVVPQPADLVVWEGQKYKVRKVQRMFTPGSPGGVRYIIHTEYSAK